MSLRTKNVEINPEDLSVKHHMEPGKVHILVIDGTQGKATLCEAVFHGQTIIETIKGKAARVNYKDEVLL